MGASLAHPEAPGGTIVVNAYIELDALPALPKPCLQAPENIWSERSPAAFLRADRENIFRPLRAQQL
jgi:hypothetical protein